MSKCMMGTPVLDSWFYLIFVDIYSLNFYKLKLSSYTEFALFFKLLPELTYPGRYCNI